MLENYYADRHKGSLFYNCKPRKKINKMILKDKFTGFWKKGGIIQKMVIETSRKGNENNIRKLRIKT